MRSLILVVLVCASATAGRSEWTGSAACGACHPKELAAWQATPHASTRARFTGRPQAQCLACHGTGEAPAGPTVAVEVGCEACHGAGAAYAEDDLMRDRPVALALGMIDLSQPKIRAQTCNACHVRRTKSTPFDLTANPHKL
ncbi:MAG TPA: multiheme c-type cytochrome [Kofleriaceae bacterium]